MTTNLTNRIVFLATLCVFAAPGASLAMAGSFEGFTEPYRTIEVAAAEMGTVAKLMVHEGDRVSRGQPLALLDNDVLEVSREIANANANAQGKIDSARADRDLRKTRLERLLPLRSQGHASQVEIDRAKAELAVAEANLRIAEEQHRLDQLESKRIEAMIERRVLRSPIDGVVTKLHKEEREFVSNVSAGVATVVQLDPMRATFMLPTLQAQSLEAGQDIALEFPENGGKAKGRVEFVAPVTEAESGAVRVKVLLDNADGHYRSGVRCSLSVPTTADLKTASSDAP